MALNTLQDLYVDEIKDLYHAEKQLVKALPQMAEKATSPDLRSAFEEHLEVTRGHVTRLEQILRELGLPKKAKTCKGMAGIVNEGKALMKEEAEKDVMDAGLIAGAQRAEHYEIAAYGTVRTYAETLGFSEAANLLEQTLEEEKQADQKLTQLAEGSINRKAEDDNGGVSSAADMNASDLSEEDMDDDFDDSEDEGDEEDVEIEEFVVEGTYQDRTD